MLDEIKGRPFPSACKEKRPTDVNETDGISAADPEIRGALDRIDISTSWSTLARIAVQSRAH